MSALSNPRNLKAFFGIAFVAAALFMSMSGAADPADVVAKATKIQEGSNEIIITNPIDESQYGIGEYVVEGNITPESKAQLVVDGKVSVPITTNKEGDYSTKIEIKKSGLHTIALKYPVKDGKDKNVKWSFEASNKKMAGDVVDSDAKKPEPKESVKTKMPENYLPDDDQSDVRYPAGSEDADKTEPNPVAVVDAKPKVKPNVAKTPVAKPGIGKKIPFAISSHSNFNLVKVGVVKVGGKGTPGDKIMLLIDGKPSMKGTVKPDGRWMFPIKVSKPGGRVITAQNLKTRQLAKVKLKFK
jgi:hypothetical protein